MYKNVDPKVNFPNMEEEIVRFWEERRIFEKSISQRKHGPDFVFYDGPPFATGLPHFGHFVPGTIKDMVPRYKAMRGFKVERRFGWDCHGLPVENLIEKELGLDSKTDIERYGVAEFNEACRASVLRYVKEWRDIVTRLGRWVDFDNDYKTMDLYYMESIWWIMKQLWDKGLIYEGHYILPYCPRCATVLSTHELAQPDVYKDVHDAAVTVRFKIISAPDFDPALAKGASYFLAWTTTPWTLPSNMALALGPDIDYVCVVDGPDRYILAESRLGSYYKDHASLTIAWKKKGQDLVGLRYEPLFPYFADAAAQGAFISVAGAHVSTEDGTGIVHTAPGFGEEDYQVLRGTGIPVVCPIDAECKFTDEVPDYKGIFVKDTDKAIIERLKAEGKLVKREQILHSYPHCWRCSSPLIYRAVGSWFVKIDPIKTDMVACNKKVTWLPAHIRDGRFGKWLENARDWAISRSRYWGNPIPIWQCADCGHTVCVGSREELKALSGVLPDDLHKHFVDNITWKCGCGGTMRRIPEVLDCWFESGAMPYAQVHYPFENKALFESNFPADFINEGLDQTRGWFYSLAVLAAALFKTQAFDACIVSGLVLAEDGKKMSKSQRNYTDPMEVVRNFGADALRLFLMNSAVTRAEDLRYSDEGVRDVLKSIILPLWSAYGFFVTYATIDGVAASAANAGFAAESGSAGGAGLAGTGLAGTNVLDRWILSLCEKMVLQVTHAMESYDIQGSISPVLDFIDALNNWYIRRSRRRFWKSESDSDKAQAYAALYRVLRRLILVAAPVVPFITEGIYQNLRTADEPESIHLCDWPTYDARLRDESLEANMASVRHAVSMGRALRVADDIKIRQPLTSVLLVSKAAGECDVLAGMEDILREELNVKKVLFRSNEEDLVEYSAKANFRTLGKELGKDMKEAAALIEKLPGHAIADILDGKPVFIDVAGRKVELDTSKIDVRRQEKPGLKVLNEGTLTVALDTAISPELLREGYVRDLVRGVQTLRKDSSFDVTDRIVLTVAGDKDLKTALDEFADFVRSETLATELVWHDAAAAEPDGGDGIGNAAGNVAGGWVDIEAGDRLWRVRARKNSF